ncbi:hypothetical protein C484_10596 [Natrialba taiwanensis DSM 12281]|uniref:Uncharacterized protein n=1 Tax=Natrialba taiwanensis DSM 12281 TaxID=1230458 RepID=L9ZY87_9EURY|nr:hypothetical protein C484_10596 [Natrialba taiwanensis DSM 12281]
MVRTTPTLIRDELDVDSTELSDSVAERYARRAHALVEERVCDIEDIDEQILEDLETLVAAHFAVSRVTGGAKGEQVTRVQQESAQVTFASASSDSAEGTSYWDQAIMLDPSGCLGQRSVAPSIVGVR